MQKRKVELILFTLSCKCCDDKQNILVDKNRAIKLEKIKNKIDISNLVPIKVKKIIEEKKLYE